MSTREFVTEVLEHRRFSILVGRKEDLWFEAKERHEFNLAGNANHRFEVAKDVSAMANADGGFLLIGLKTEPVLEEKTDQVSELNLITADQFDADQFFGVIKDCIHPPIRGLDVKWIESAETAAQGLGCVIIPPQSEDDRPFLMKHVFDGDAKLRHIVFGIARRIGSSNRPLTIEELHHDVQQGKASVPDRLTRIERELAEIKAMIGTQRPAAVAPADVLDARIDEAFGQ